MKPRIMCERVKEDNIINIERYSSILKKSLTDTIAWKLSFLFHATNSLHLNVKVIFE